MLNHSESSGCKTNAHLTIFGTDVNSYSLTLCQQFANEQALVGLLRVYKNFCPEIIISQNVGGRPPQSVCSFKTCKTIC
jgi:hypothetical protein